MRSMKTGCISIALLICLCIFSAFHTQKIAHEISDTLSAAQQSVQAEAWDNAMTYVEAATDNWDRHEVFMGLSQRHDQLDQVSLNLSVLKEHVSLQNQDSFLTSYAYTQKLFEIVVESQMPTLKNIL